MPCRPIPARWQLAWDTLQSRGSTGRGPPPQSPGRFQKLHQGAGVRTEGGLLSHLAWHPGCLPSGEAWDLSEPGFPEVVK